MSLSSLLEVYPFGDLENVGFAANAMEEAATRVVIKQLIFEHEQAKAELVEIAGEAQKNHEKLRGMALAKKKPPVEEMAKQKELEVQGLEMKKQMKATGGMIKDMNERNHRAIKLVEEETAKLELAKL